ncbi:MAG: hypothetical protein ACLTXT_07460 [Ruminococcus callidus]
MKKLVEDGDLSAGHARALLAISDEKLLSETAAKAAEGKLTVCGGEDRRRRGKARKNAAVFS